MKQISKKKHTVRHMRSVLQLRLKSEFAQNGVKLLIFRLTTTLFCLSNEFTSNLPTIVCPKRANQFPNM